MKSEPVLKKIKISNEKDYSSSDIDDPDEIESVNEAYVKGEFDGKETVVSGGNGGKVVANFFNEELTSDDEILTFQCPENFNMNLLLNKHLSLSEVTTIGENENKYNCYVLPNTKKQFTCIVPGRKGNSTIVNLPVGGHIVVEKELHFLKTEICSDDNDNDETDSNLDSDSGSENERIRHPLLGKDYEEHLKTVSQHMRKYKKMMKKSIKHEKSLEKAEKERKEQKKKLKNQLSLLKKSLEVNDS